MLKYIIFKGDLFCIVWIINYGFGVFFGIVIIKYDILYFKLIGICYG